MEITPQVKQGRWRRSGHRALSALSTRFWAATRPRLTELVYANGGVGDELMLTAVARAARAAGRALHILTDVPELWRGNADPASVQCGIDQWFYAARRHWIATHLKHLSYDTGRAGRHIAQQMADHLGLILPPSWQPVLTPRSVKRQPRRIVVQNSCRGARYSSPTKEWPQANWQALVELLAGYELVQLGTSSDPPLPGARDLRGRTSLRAAAECIASAGCFVGLESGLMHVAAAVATPAVVIYGGRTRPSQTGYPQHRHMVRQPPCAGCALQAGCPHENVCMDIPAAEVAAAVHDLLGREGRAA